ncbi:MAG: division plane positioning ATPase MipZ [Kiloniellaceae bacterium]
MDLLSRLTDPLLAKAERARTKSFLDAAMASAALAACADGPVTFAKRLALDQILDNVDALRAVEAHTAVDLFEGFVREIHQRPEHGRARALMALSAFAGNRDSARLLVQVARAMARAEGRVSPPARAEIAHMAAALGVPAPGLDEAVPGAAAPAPRRTVIVLGNEKGGTGKSTTAMHLAVALVNAGHIVGSIDLDGRQGTLSRYIANRALGAENAGREIPVPRHRRITESEARDRVEARAEDKASLERALADLADCRVVVIDTPGSNAHLSRLGHAHADILITPLNDSFLDIDVLARIDRERREVLEPSAYARMVWEQSDLRAARGQDPIDWIVMRNRLAHIDARNTREMAGLLDRLAGHMGFRLQRGFSERVVFRELFYRGLTLFDLPDDGADPRLRSSHLHARREVQDLLEALRMPDLAPKAAARRTVA